MADVFGRVSTLPGAHHTVPNGQVCDAHEDKPAIYRIQGETDSMGCEVIDMCSDCYAAYQAQVEASNEELQFCDWCKNQVKGCRPYRDMDEGMAGPVYTVCPSCRAKDCENARQELEEMHGYDDYDPAETCEGDW